MGLRSLIAVLEFRSQECSSRLSDTNITRLMGAPKNPLHNRGSWATLKGYTSSHIVAYSQLLIPLTQEAQYTKAQAGGSLGLIRPL